MISASHNPFDDNGIKFFGPDGYKLDDDVELAIETALLAENTPQDSDKIGRTAIRSKTPWIATSTLSCHGNEKDLY